MHVSREQLIQRAGIDDAYVDRLRELGAIQVEGEEYEERDVRVAALLHMWESAGLSAPAILEAVHAGTVSLDFMEAPAWDLPEPMPITYRRFAEERGVPLDMLGEIQAAMGFAAPDPDDLVVHDDDVLADLLRIVLELGASEEAARRLFRLYADNIRRLAMAEADLYLEEMERSWAGAGADESELMLRGADLGRRMSQPVLLAIQVIYRRYRQHIWTGYGIQRAEMALERAGVLERVRSTPAVCFVDMTGYTRLTEERGDEESARLATTLAALVNEISRAHGGRAIRWLGDGGLFFFEDVDAALRASLEMSERAPAAGLPPTHIGVQAGPVVFRDGDVYGRTVNIASRIADQAGAGEILTSEEAIAQVDGADFAFSSIRSVELKGLTKPLTLYRVTRSSPAT